MDLNTKYGNIKIFAETIEDEALSQIIQFANSVLGENSHIRIMSDCHAGAGCVIGTTMKITDKICPNLVGVDTQHFRPINIDDILFYKNAIENFYDEEVFGYNVQLMRRIIMKKYKGYVSTGYVGSDREFEFEVDETCEDVEQMALEAMCNEIEWGYEEIED